MYKDKKKKSRAIIFAIIGVAIVGAFFLVNPIRSLIAISTMKPLASQEVMPGIYAINNGYVNLYLFKSGDQYIAFDAGVDNDATDSALINFGIDAGDIAAIFLTHTDYDHVAAVSLFKTAQVYMSESNRIFLEGSAGRSRSENFVGMKRDFNTLKDGEAIGIADVQIQCIFTPGHTDGSVSYVVDGKYLFSGDNLNLKNGKTILFNSVFNMNGDEQKQSLHRLSRLEGIDALFTMHTGYTTDFKTALAEWSE